MKGAKGELQPPGINWSGHCDSPQWETGAWAALGMGCDDDGVLFGFSGPAFQMPITISEDANVFTDNAEIFFWDCLGRLICIFLYRWNIYIYTLFRFAFHLCIRIYLNLEIFNWKTGMQDGYSMVRFGNVSQWTLLTASESLDNAHE